MMTAFLIISLVLTASCGRDGSDGGKTVLLVSAAASLKDSLEPIERMFEQDHEDINIRYNYGSSGTLQKQIAQGAPADLFLSAGKRQMEDLVRRHLIGESRDVLANRLVLILKSGFAKPVDDLHILQDSTVKKIAVGQPETVPAGIYAKQSLTAFGLWDELASKLIYAQDVRQVLAFVETGNADAGLVYRTDAAESDKIMIASPEIPAGTHDPIVYPFGIIADTKHPEEARAFFRFLLSEPAMNVFREQGFTQP